MASQSNSGEFGMDQQRSDAAPAYLTVVSSNRQPEKISCPPSTLSEADGKGTKPQPLTVGSTSNHLRRTALNRVTPIAEVSRKGGTHHDLRDDAIDVRACRDQPAGNRLGLRRGVRAHRL